MKTHFLTVSREYGQLFLKINLSYFSQFVSNLKVWALAMGRVEIRSPFKQEANATSAFDGLRNLRNDSND